MFPLPNSSYTKRERTVSDTPKEKSLRTNLRLRLRSRSGLRLRLSLGLYRWFRFNFHLRFCLRLRFPLRFRFRSYGFRHCLRCRRFLGSLLTVPASNNRNLELPFTKFIEQFTVRSLQLSSLRFPKEAFGGGAATSSPTVLLFFLRAMTKTRKAGKSAALWRRLSSG